MRFATRCDFEEVDSSLTRALLAVQNNGKELIDLTVSNPTKCGFSFYRPNLLEALTDPRALRYLADPLGDEAARSAVAQRYEGITPDQVLMTASTSESYGFLLKLLCDPGDAILVPSPSYPLFDLLARLHDVEVNTYPLVFHDGWQVDPASLAAAVTPRTRAIVAVHPNNPTGHFYDSMDRDTVRDVSVRHGLALIADEVFLEYPVEAAAEPSFAGEDTPVLTFVMGGASKLLSLPQMKLAWTVICGPEQQRNEALQRLEVIADTFLSVAAPPQMALPSWLSRAPSIQGEILNRIRVNLAALDSLIAADGVVSRLPVEAGWVALLRIPATGTDVDQVAVLLSECGVLVQPGSFYGLPAAGWIAISLLVDPEVFLAGVGAVMAFLQREESR